MSLPIDMWLEVSKYISVDDQPAFYRVNKAIQALPIQNYIHVPSNNEIVNWLFMQSEQIKYSIFKHGKLNNIIQLRFQFDHQSIRMICFNLTDGKIYRPTISGNSDKYLSHHCGFYVTVNYNNFNRYSKENLTIINTKNEILEYLDGTTLDLSWKLYGINWLITREILSFRKSYKNISIDKCFIELMAKYLTSNIPEIINIYGWLSYLHAITKLLNDTAGMKLENDFSQLIDKPINSSIYCKSLFDHTRPNFLPYKVDNTVYCDWLSNWILQLDSNNLGDNLDIMTYINHEY